MLSLQPRFDIRAAAPRIVLALGAVAGLNLAFYFALTEPAVASYRQLEATTRPDFDELKDRETVVKRLERYRDGLHAAEVELTRLRDELGTRDERLVAVQAELADLCAQFNIDWESVGYGHELLFEEGLDRLEIVVPLSGGYANLRRFLQALEESKNFLIIERVGLAKGREGGRMLELSINLATYFNAPPELIELHREAKSTRRGRR
jgi:Tfp pilus assembly protein PilO